MNGPPSYVLASSQEYRDLILEFATFDLLHAKACTPEARSRLNDAERLELLKAVQDREQCIIHYPPSVPRADLRHKLTVLKDLIFHCDVWDAGITWTEERQVRWDLLAESVVRDMRTYWGDLYYHRVPEESAAAALANLKARREHFALPPMPDKVAEIPSLEAKTPTILPSEDNPSKDKDSNVTQPVLPVQTAALDDNLDSRSETASSRRITRSRTEPSTSVQSPRVPVKPSLKTPAPPRDPSKDEGNQRVFKKREGDELTEHKNTKRPKAVRPDQRVSDRDSVVQSGRDSSKSPFKSSRPKRAKKSNVVSTSNGEGSSDSIGNYDNADDEKSSSSGNSDNQKSQTLQLPARWSHTETLPDGRRLFFMRRLKRVSYFVIGPAKGASGDFRPKDCPNITAGHDGSEQVWQLAHGRARPQYCKEKRKFTPPGGTQEIDQANHLNLEFQHIADPRWFVLRRRDAPAWDDPTSLEEFMKSEEQDMRRLLGSIHTRERYSDAEHNWLESHMRDNGGLEKWTKGKDTYNRSSPEYWKLLNDFDATGLGGGGGRDPDALFAKLKRFAEQLIKKASASAKQA